MTMRMPLTTWIATCYPTASAEHVLATAAAVQLNTLHHSVSPILRHFDDNADMYVVGTHGSKRVGPLPVVEMSVPRFGLTLFASHDYRYGVWTVKAERGITGLNIDGLEFPNLSKNPYRLFDGFKESGIEIFGSYADSNQAFSFLSRSVMFVEILLRLLAGAV